MVEEDRKVCFDLSRKVHVADLLLFILQFREYLQEHGYDLSNLGLDSETSSSIGETDEKEKDSDVKVSVQPLDK